MDSDYEEEYIFEEEEKKPIPFIKKYDVEETSVMSESDTVYDNMSHSVLESIINDKQIKNVKTSEVMCERCKTKFNLEKKASIIKCINCGNRILYKIRTKNPIYYNSN